MIMNRRDFFRLLGNSVTKGNESNRPKYGKISRRQLLAISAAELAVAASAITVYKRQVRNSEPEEHKTEERLHKAEERLHKIAERFVESIKEQDKIYGTLQNPKYTLLKAHESRFPTVDQDPLLGIFPFKAFEEFEDKFDGLEKKLRYYQKELPLVKSGQGVAQLNNHGQSSGRQIKTDKSQLMIGEIYGILKEMDRSWHYLTDRIYNTENEISIQRKNPNLSTKSLSEQVPIYGDIIEKGNEIIYKITGKHVPDSLEVKIEDIDRPTVMGETNLLNNYIRYEDSGYERSLICHLHEFAHKIYRGETSFLSDYSVSELKKLNIDDPDFVRRLGEIDIISEASSSLFSIAGTEEATKMHPELGERMRTILSAWRISRLRYYEKGSDDKPDKGWALVEALLQYYHGDYVTASNCLAGINQFDKLPLEITLMYRSFRKGIPRKGKGFGDMGLLVTQWAKIRDQYLDLIVKYGTEDLSPDEVWEKVSKSE